MKRIILVFTLFLSLNAYSQTNKSILIDNIKTIVISDLDRYADLIATCMCKGKEDTVNVTYFRETVMISFNTEEYIELAVISTEDNDSPREKIRGRFSRSVPRAKWILNAIDSENKILCEYFDCFIYKYSVRYKEEPGLEIEYRIKADDYGMRIIGRKIHVVLVSDN